MLRPRHCHRRILRLAIMCLPTRYARHLLSLLRKSYLLPPLDTNRSQDSITGARVERQGHQQFFLMEIRIFLYGSGFNESRLVVVGQYCQGQLFPQHFTPQSISDIQEYSSQFSISFKLSLNGVSFRPWSSLEMPTRFLSSAPCNSPQNSFAHLC